MKNRLENILDIIRELNTQTNIVKKSELDEQYENLKDLEELTVELDDLVSQYKSSKAKNADEVESVLFEIHRILTTLEWHISEISDINTKLLKNYKNTKNNR
jgi:predicted nuclease with TOPRIM domain